MSSQNCPVCGSKVKVVGDETKHYEPITNSKECQDFALWIAKYGIYKIPDKPDMWWFNQQDGKSPEKTTEDLYNLYLVSTL